MPVHVVLGDNPARGPANINVDASKSMATQLTSLTGVDAEDLVLPNVSSTANNSDDELARRPWPKSPGV